MDVTKQYSAVLTQYEMRRMQGLEAARAAAAASPGRGPRASSIVDRLKRALVRTVPPLATPRVCAGRRHGHSPGIAQGHLMGVTEGTREAVNLKRGEARPMTTHTASRLERRDPAGWARPATLSSTMNRGGMNRGGMNRGGCRFRRRPFDGSWDSATPGGGTDDSTRGRGSLSGTGAHTTI